MKQRSFSEPGCIGCEAHLDFGLSRYCAGFKNKKRRKAFRKSDPAYKAPKWCPKRKEPCEYRIYSYADEQAAMMARAVRGGQYRRQGHRLSQRVPVPAARGGQDRAVPESLL